MRCRLYLTELFLSTPSQLGGRHSHPAVTAPTIALDFLDTTQQSASRNVAPNQLGGRHSHPVVTAPTIALDFSDTTQQSASRNVAPNQILNKDTSSNNSSLLPLKLPRQLPFKIPRSLNLPKIPNILAQTNERKLTQRIETHDATYCSTQQLRVLVPAQFNRLKRVANERAKQGESSATKISRNKGWMRWKI
ncbi:ferredoxin--NADP reductase, root isozyme, chloroplastic [Dorcoceras hygrometricum]|uniref:Ferredoxin--NADP reductase, root isozyme, chloroplastic n=1 Tax=Dorcoceras hygrometricum TaxID=472368 RepID=A0A2Z7AA78_9LAMI|nr:ferredoxin--NADP reductase, root isozyme, chloroplastic [Dorcoceras hygrometricum]